MKPHKHADILRAIADGVMFPDDFERKYPGDTSWGQAVIANSGVLLMEEGEFRLKSTSKPDVVKPIRVHLSNAGYILLDLNGIPNIEFTFADDDLTKPKSVKLL